MLQHVVSLTPAVAGIASVFVTCHGRHIDPLLSHVAIPLPNGSITKIRVQKKITDFFSIKRAPVVGKTVKVQQKLTKYFSMRPKAGRPGAEAPRSHRRRHRVHHHHHRHHHLTMSIQCRTRSHHHHHCPAGCSPIFPLGKVLRLPLIDGVANIVPIRAGLNVKSLK